LGGLFIKLTLPLTLVIHCNHPNELNDELFPLLQAINLPHIQLLNQSVLLNGINDKASTLIELSEKLLKLGILPYYLHQLDPVAGSQHFQVGDSEARQIIDKMQRELPGYLVPKLVREVAGEPYKKTLL